MSYFLLLYLFHYLSDLTIKANAVNTVAGTHPPPAAPARHDANIRA